MEKLFQDCKKSCKTVNVGLLREDGRGVDLLCSGSSYFLMVPLGSKRCMLLVLIVVVSLNFFKSPSSLAAFRFSSDKYTSKFTDLSSLYCL